MKISGIYIILNKVNNKWYVGSSRDIIGDRWPSHKRQLRRDIHYNPYLQNAWNKYGEENFEFHVVELVEESLLLIIEQKYLNCGKLLCKDMLYNIAEDSLSPMRNRKQSKESLEKMKISQNKKEVRIKSKINYTETMMSKYGVKHNFYLDSFRDDVKKRCVDKYGVRNPFESEIIKKQIKNTLLEKYGVDNISKNQIIKDKKMKNCIEKFGGCLMGSPILKEKIKTTVLQKYGVENPSQSIEIKLKKKQKSDRFRLFLSNMEDDEFEIYLQNLNKTEQWKRCLRTRRNLKIDENHIKK